MGRFNLSGKKNENRCLFGLPRSLSNDCYATTPRGFPPLESLVSSLGNFIFQGWKVFGNALRRFVLLLLPLAKMVRVAQSPREDFQIATWRKSISHVGVK